MCSATQHVGQTVTHVGQRASLADLEQCAHQYVPQIASLWCLLCDQLPHQNAIAEDVSSLIASTRVHTNMGCQQACHSTTSSEYCNTSRVLIRLTALL